MHSINRYAEIRKQTSRVGERPLIALPKIPNELELQARWFAGEFGRKFRTLAGEAVEIVQFGFWNREAGPDFQNAVVASEMAPPRAAQSKSICSIAIGNSIAIQPTRHSMTPFCTFFSNEAVSNFLPAPALIETWPRSNSISPRCEMSRPG